MRKLAFASLVAAGVACSSTYGETNGSEPPSDAGADVGAPDASTDAPVDAPKFCATELGASFCWSFDEGPDPLLGPVLRVADKGFPPTLTSAALSPPNAMLSETPLDAGALSASALVFSDDASTHVRCQLALAIDHVGGNVAYGLAMLAKNLGGPSFGLLLVPGATSAKLQVAVDLAHADVGEIRYGQWIHVGLDVVANETTYTATGSIEALAFGVQSKDVDGGTAGGIGKHDVFVGVTVAPGGWQIRYDDVVCRH